MLFGMSFEDKLAAFGMKCLTVAGAFLAGWVLGILLGMGLNRWVFKTKMPEVMKKALKIICATVVALIVAVLIFGGGAGGGSFGGGTEGSGGGTTTDQDKNKTSNPKTDTPKDDKKSHTPSTLPDPRTTEVTIRVTVLGGSDVQDEKFYLIDDDRTAKTLGDVKAALSARKSKETRKLVVAILRSERQPLPLEHAGWTKLVKAVQDEIKLDITFPATK